VLLQAVDLRFAYRGPARVIDGVSLDVRQGSLVGLLGPNGSGKTTLLRLLAGALRPESGCVRLDGTEVTRIPRRALARRLAVVPQETPLAFDYTALEIVLMGRYPHLGAFRVEGPADLASARSALDATGMVALAERQFRTLSGGEKQRVIIASALAQLDASHIEAGATSSQVPSARGQPPILAPPALLFLDEPTASLDLRYQHEVASLLRDLHAARGITIVLTTHDLRFAASVCSEILLISRGRLLATGPPLEVLTPPAVAELYGIDASEAPPIAAEVARARGARPASRPEPRGAGEIGAGGPQPIPLAPAVRHPLGRGAPAVAASFVLMAAALLSMPFIGSTPLDFGRVFSRRAVFADNVDAQIFFVARLPRVLAAALVGGTLAAAGVVFQGLLRNALATPYTLGVSAGAALGAMIAITFGTAIAAGGVASASLVGAFVAVLVVYMLASARHRGLSTTVLLLAGVTLNAFFSAMILFVQYLSDFAETYRALRWLMGDLDVSGYMPIVAALPLIFIAFVAFAWLARPLNLLSVGVEGAGARGLHVDRTQRAAFFGASLATGAAVSVGGPIGFVGIIVPHLVRLVVGSDHRLVLPASTFFGAAFLILCDALARTAFAPLELPVGIVTAVIGGPFFLWLLVRHR
jgi:iron complex transport system permease protein